MEKPGVIYIVQSPLLNGIKVGLTTQDRSKLGTRYATYYGNELTVHVYESDNTVNHERAIHWQLRDHHITGELFNADCIDAAVTACREVTRSVGTRNKYMGGKTAVRDPTPKKKAEPKPRGRPQIRGLEPIADADNGAAAEQAKLDAEQAELDAELAELATTLDKHKCIIS